MARCRNFTLNNIFVLIIRNRGGADLHKTRVTTPPMIRKGPIGVVDNGCLVTNIHDGHLTAGYAHSI